MKRRLNASMTEQNIICFYLKRLNLYTNVYRKMKELVNMLALLSKSCNELMKVNYTINFVMFYHYHFTVMPYASERRRENSLP